MIKPRVLLLCLISLVAWLISGCASSMLLSAEHTTSTTAEAALQWERGVVSVDAGVQWSDDPYTPKLSGVVRAAAIIPLR